MALSRPPLSDLIKSKLAIMSRDAEHILLRRSQAIVNCNVFFEKNVSCLFKASTRTTYKFSRHVVWLTPQAQDGEFMSVLSTTELPPTAWLHACLPQPQLFSPESRVNYLQLIWPPKNEYCWDHVWKDAIWKSRNVLWIRKFSFPPAVICTISPIKETLDPVYNYFTFQYNLTLK